MREAADLIRIQRFMRALGDLATGEARVYFTGGTTAVLHGWRASTLDVHIKLLPERDELFRAIPGLKERLRCAQALAKIERGHAQDLADVRELLGRDLIDRRQVANYFEAIAGSLYRYPALDPLSFRERVDRALADGGAKEHPVRR